MTSRMESKDGGTCGRPGEEVPCQGTAHTADLAHLPGAAPSCRSPYRGASPELGDRGSAFSSSDLSGVSPPQVRSLGDPRLHCFELSRG